MNTQTDTPSLADAAYEMAERAEKHPAAVALGALGGKRKSPAQVAARQQNAQKARLAAEAKRAQMKHNAEIAALLTKGSQ